MGGGGTSQGTSASPEQRQLLKTLMPLYEQTARRGLIGQGAFQVPQQQVVDYSRALPTQDFFGQIDPEFIQGITGQYDLAREKTLDFLASRGQGGSARGGVSGVGGVALGELGNLQSQQMNQQLFNLYSPIMQQQLATEQQANRDVFGAQLGALQQPFGLLGQTPNLLPTPTITPQGPSALQSAAGGAMTGYSIGGPYGALAGGVIGAMSA